jgi:hypothetical protein
MVKERIEYFFTSGAKTLGGDLPRGGGYFLHSNAIGVAEGVDAWASFMAPPLSDCKALIENEIRKAGLVNDSGSSEGDSCSQDSFLVALDETLRANESQSFLQSQSQFQLQLQFQSQSQAQAQAQSQAHSPSRPLAQDPGQCDSAAVLCVLSSGVLFSATIGLSSCLLLRFTEVGGRPDIVLHLTMQRPLPLRVQLHAPCVSAISNPGRRCVGGYVEPKGLQGLEQSNGEKHQLARAPVQSGDLLIIASDGLLDTLIVEDLLEIVQESVLCRSPKERNTQELASEIAYRLYNHSKTTRALCRSPSRSPWQPSAIKGQVGRAKLSCT